MVTAQIRAASVSVAGKVNGNIVATQRIEIRASAKVRGNITRLPCFRFSMARCSMGIARSRATAKTAQRRYVADRPGQKQA